MTFIKYIHWFNPLVWVAFVLAGRDMEMSCDEAVIRKLGEDVRAEYSASLLNLATGKRLFAGTPLAFDEGAPTERVRNLAKWKKPAFWVILICAIVCVVLAVCLLTDPSKGVSEETHSYEQYYVIDEQSVVVTGVARDSTIAVKFKKTSGPRSFVVDLQYKTKEDSAWTRLSPQTLEIAETCAFWIPTGYASVEITSVKYKIDRTSIQTHLCENCIQSMNCVYWSEEAPPEFAVVNFSEKTIRPLDKALTWLFSGNFGISCEYEEDGDIDLLIAYLPPRWKT